MKSVLIMIVGSLLSSGAFAAKNWECRRADGPPLANEPWALQMADDGSMIYFAGVHMARGSEAGVFRGDQPVAHRHPNDIVLHHHVVHIGAGTNGEAQLNWLVSVKSSRTGLDQTVSIDLRCEELTKL